MSTFTAYITSYALTDGIKVIQAEESGISPGMAVERRDSLRVCYHGNDWHRTPEAAIARAEEIRVRKIASLEKQIAKLRKLTFQVPA